MSKESTMQLPRKNRTESAPKPAERSEGVAERSAAGLGAARASAQSPPAHRWSARRKLAVIMRLLRGESLDAVSRDTGLPTHRLNRWRERALAGMEASLKDRGGDPQEVLLKQYNAKISELVMEVDLLKKKTAGKILRWKP